MASSALLLHFAFISLLSPPPPSRKWRLSKLMMDAVLLKMQLLKYFDSSYFVEVGLKLHESQLHHFFQCKSSTRKKIACSTCMNLDGGKLRNDPQNCTTDFVQNNTANVDMWQPRKHKPDPHPKPPKLMHHGHQSFYCLCHRVFLCNVRSRKNLGIKNISFFPSRFMFGYSRVSIQLPMTARVKILKI